MTFLLVLLFSMLALYGNQHTSGFKHSLYNHEDVYVGQPAEIKGVSIGQSRFEFSFSPENRMEMCTTLEQVFRDAVTQVVGEEQMILLTCYINGINVHRHEFDESIQRIHAYAKGQVPVIGLYNATRGFISDTQRLFLEKKGIATISKVALQNFLGTAMEYFSQLNPRFLILLFAHSEGGLLLEQAIEGLGDWGKEMAKKHLIIRTFGSVHAVEDHRAKDVLNVYSDNDHAAFAFVKEKFHLSHHSFLFYPSFGLSDSNDHAFLGLTYQHAVSDQMQHLFKKYVPLSIAN